jgi:glutaredoxin
LKNDNIPYVEVDIDNNHNLWDQVVNQTGHNVVPSVFIQKEENDDGPIYIPGKDFEDEDTIVNIIKTYI